MSTLRVSTLDVESGARLRYWQEAVCDVFVELRAGPVHPADADSFAGEIVRTHVDGLVVDTVTADGNEVARTPRLISHSSSDDLFVSVLERSTGVFTQDGREARLVHPGDFVLYDSARPYRGGFLGRGRQIVVRIPREALATRLPRHDRVTAVTVSGRTGVGALASGLLRALPRCDDDAPLVGDHVLDLLAAALHPLTGGGLDGGSARATQLARARAFIRARLPDPGLGPTTVADAIGVSERYLYTLFEAAGTTPARWIGEERLAQAHARLGDPRRAGSTIEEIALGVGFKQAAHFTRAFKARYGITPRERRSLCRQGQEPVR
jgi:AraC-like DNA-binding protein